MAETSTSRTTEIAASLILLAAALAALIVANSALADLYATAKAAPVTIGIGDIAITDSIKSWIKNALMAVFFLFVGLEIKYEFKEGTLASRERAIVPFAGALGGMALPAAIYLVVVAGDPVAARGWAIPCATDIAFAVGIVGLLGTRVAPALKAFLLAVAVIDDLGAILIIALFYTDRLDWLALALALVVTGLLAVANHRGVMRLGPYLGLGLVLWVALHQSGVNPTLAGVITALFVPLRDARTGRMPLYSLAHALRLPVIFAIMPVFAFANAGVPLLGLGLADIGEPVTLGIALGLLIGKPIGISAVVYLVVRSGMARLPAAVRWIEVIGVGFIAGIGFTMSLFIGALAFEDETLMDRARLGVLSGSTLAALAGVAVIVASARRSISPR
ncbi:MAG: Na+/H+ antiporter NhaA [Alphaproteobacteria bacterium]|nr:Na+/H+ antiporter NhaA [Alphaproteobacteria bacterium]